MKQIDKSEFNRRNDMTKRKKIVKLFLIIIAIIIILILAIYANHRIHLIKEANFLSTLGEIVQVDGNNLSVYTEGDGETTLIFMSGAGTSSPILDFKSLYSCLSDKYKIAVVEKLGYGFSDIVDKSRDIDSMLEDTRAALTAAGLNAPYVLCPLQCPVLKPYIGHRNIPMRYLQLLDLIWQYPRITKACKSIYRLCVFQVLRQKSE